MRALLSDPGGTSALGHCCASVLPSAISDGVGSHENRNFEAQSHGPLARCLRFAGRVTPSPRKTRFRLPAWRCRAGLVARWVPVEGFCFVASSFSKLCLAHREFTVAGPTFAEACEKARAGALDWPAFARLTTADLAGDRRAAAAALVMPTITAPPRPRS